MSALVEVRVPRLGDDVGTAVLVAWHVEPGARVRDGDVLFEVETDKAVFEVEAEVDGVVVEVLAEAGADVAPDQVVARIRPEPA
ncbi:biotin/lipoyl-containing protein [Deferrisoma palaeochoriense]